MASPKTANPATADTVNGIRDFEQFGGPLGNSHTPKALASQPPSIILTYVLAALNEGGRA